VDEHQHADEVAAKSVPDGLVCGVGQY